MTEENQGAKPAEVGTGKANLVYPALFLHSAGKPVNEDNLKKIAKAVSISVDDAQIKALVSALDGVNIDEAVKQSFAVAAAPSSGAGTAKVEEKKEEKKEEQKREEAVEGLSGLFG